MKKIYAFRVVSIILLAVWMSAIFIFSAQNATESARFSSGITHKVFCAFYPDFEELSAESQAELISKASFPIRKAAHFSEYALLGALSFFAVCSYKSISLKARNLIAVGISVLYSVSDEIHQIFVPRRACRFFDIVIDCLGAISAILLLTILMKRREQNG